MELSKIKLYFLEQSIMQQSIMERSTMKKVIKKQSIMENVITKQPKNEPTIMEQSIMGQSIQKQTIGVNIVTLKVLPQVRNTAFSHEKRFCSILFYFYFLNDSLLCLTFMRQFQDIPWQRIFHLQMLVYLSLLCWNIQYIQFFRKIES